MKTIVLGILMVLFLTEAYSQSVLSDWDIKVGFNLSDPKVTRRNESYTVSPSLSWQIGLGRTLPVTKVLTFHLSGEYDQLNTRLDRSESNNTLFFSRDVTMSYLFLNASIKAEKNLGQFVPFGGIGGRGGVLLNDNLEDVFVVLASRESYDYGLVFSFGTAYQLKKISPFVEVGYYHSLLNLTPNSVIDGSGQSFSDEFVNRLWFLSIGIRFN